jgi:predicted dithiol-disulfide oxidoreductase (DUF899 family)
MKNIENPRIVSRADWLSARQKHLAREKEITRLHDQLVAERRELPWMKVEKDYRFEAPGGEMTLAELFAGRSQLIVYHFMFGPDWEQGCKSCSFLMDHIEGARMHFEHHDVTFVAIARAPLEKIEAFKRRMGWRFPWVSSFRSDFNFDHGVSFNAEQLAKGPVPYNYSTTDYGLDELPGASVFFKDEAGTVFQTYAAYARGLDILLGAHNFLDLTPRGRNEKTGMDWVRHHDRYDDNVEARTGLAAAGAL